jgi:hypothetical protein
MKNQNYLMTGLAIVGAISLIIMACSAEDSQESNSTNNVNSIGKYQITSGNGSGSQFYVIDTETGVVKSYSISNPSIVGSPHVLKETIITQ